MPDAAATTLCLPPRRTAFDLASRKTKDEHGGLRSGGATASLDGAERCSQTLKRFTIARFRSQFDPGRYVRRTEWQRPRYMWAIFGKASTAKDSAPDPQKLPDGR